MRALVIGDIHTEVDLLARTLAFGASEGVDKVLSVGDIVDGPGDPLACIAQLRAANADVVRGNHERWVVQGHPMDAFDYPAEALAWFAALPATREYDTPTGRLLLCHGVGTNDMQRFEPDTNGYALECLGPLFAPILAAGFRWAIGGHTHLAMVRHVDDLVFVNPGTLVRLQKPGFMIVDFARGEVDHYALTPALSRVERWALSP